MTSLASVVTHHSGSGQSGEATSHAFAVQKPSSRLLHLPAEVLQDHLLPQVRAQGRGVQAAFASTCRTAHQHVMEAVTKPLFGRLQRHVSMGDFCALERRTGPHPTALGYEALGRLTGLFRLHGYRPAPASVVHIESMEPAAALNCVDHALDAILAASGRSPVRLPTTLSSAIQSLQHSMQAPLQAWTAGEESDSTANILGFRRTQSMILEMAGQAATQIEVAVFCRPRTLPPVWLYLAHLKVLGCRNAYLAQLPEDIGHLWQLHELDVSHSRLTTLPSALEQLPLKRLLLRGNQMTVIPDVVTRLPRLRALELFGNPLVDPTFSSGFEHLTVLDIGGCGLSRVPESVFGLVSLEHLGLCANTITSLPDELRNLSRLTLLDVSCNRIQAVPAALISLTQLQALYLNDNPLLALPVFVGHLPKLKELCVSAGDDEGAPPTHSLMLPEWIGHLRAVGSGWYSHPTRQYFSSDNDD